jgi:hypothetical protein
MLDAMPASISFWMPMKSLIVRLLLVVAVLANLVVGQGMEASAHPASHQAQMAAAVAHDCCDPAVAHEHDHAALPDGLAADCHCDLGTCAPGVTAQVDTTLPSTRLVQPAPRIPDDAPRSSAHIPPLRPPRA